MHSLQGNDVNAPRCHEVLRLRFEDSFVSLPFVSEESALKVSRRIQFLAYIKVHERIAMLFIPEAITYNVLVSLLTLKLSGVYFSEVFPQTKILLVQFQQKDRKLRLVQL